MNAPFDASVDAQGNVTLTLHINGQDDALLVLTAIEPPEERIEPSVWVRTVDLQEWLNALIYVLQVTEP